ncbi:cytochrome c family protein [Magnetococcus marinus MC-1]|uniref:Cytochrome c family protein n=1 Tax=Magnetococcus marinus (strain ATCC BAA-1437 / JCM 17883 / MC-1) TaxID=156889 RepID=A0L603_MAGMM|nr:tetrathionate reductase family octaheme c-type cytochrome [Magnetococcus marinus]ABK43396.1 cytochrome c family protein [Magnetococcus marinus MC-1]
MRVPMHTGVWVLFFMAGLLLGSTTLHAEISTDGKTDSKSTANHSKFKQLEGPFNSGPEVTKACLGCHTEAAKQVMKTKHWTWESKQADTGQMLGKKHVVNSFCGTPKSNWAACTACHAGYGWQDNDFDFTKQENVDCLVCHDHSGQYEKSVGGAGHPKGFESPEHKKYLDDQAKAPRDAVDLVAAAQSVGRPSRRNCGSCHFVGGGDDGVKHGDMDTSLIEPDEFLDVHMDVNGKNFSCTACHRTHGHVIPGSRYKSTAKDTKGVETPSEAHSRTSCESCHGSEVKKHSAKLNDHVDKVACQTCHIPKIARGGVKTKMVWDWSTAGKLDENGKPISERNSAGEITYSSKKGHFEWAEDVQPEYRWFDGQVRYTLFGDKVDDSKPVQINGIHGSYTDNQSRIWPFKIMKGKQVYDPVEKHLLVMHTYGDDDSSFWSNFDWKKSLEAGAKEPEAPPFNGQYAFVNTEMYWPITHMVAPASDALKCKACHVQEGRLAALTDFYMPGRDRQPVLDGIGWFAVLMTSVGVVGHGSLRVYWHYRRRRREKRQNGEAQ